MITENSKFIKKKQYRSAVIIAIVFSIIINLLILFLIFLNYSYNLKSKMITVDFILINDVNEDVEKISSRDKKKYFEKREKAKNKIISDIKNEKQVIEKQLIFEKNKKETVNDNEIADLDKKLKSLDDTLNSINESNGDSGNDSALKNNNGINWENGRVRKLIQKGNIEIPDEYKKTGLKTNLVLKFSVLNNGLISKTDVLISSGNTLLDEVVINQFKKWKFEEVETNDVAYGVIEISIGY